MEMLTKDAAILNFTEEGIFEGVAAAYGNVDSHGDVIQPGAFKSAEGAEIPLLFAHKTDQPIGVATVTETPKGLMLKGRLVLETTAGAEAFALIKAGAMKGLSVGFQLPKDGFSIVNRVRTITKAILKEVSLVVFPANERALISAVKEEDDDYPSPRVRSVGDTSPFPTLLRFTLRS